MTKSIKYFLCGLTFCLCRVIGIGQQNKIDSLLSVIKTTKEDSTKINTFNILFLEYEFTDDVKATESLKKALDLSEKINYKKGLATTYLYLGYFAEDKGDSEKALKEYFASLKIELERADKKGIANAYNNIGTVYKELGNYPEALKNYFACLKIYEATFDKKGISISFNNIGIVYYLQQNYPEALKNQFASLKIKEEIGDKSGIAYSYLNIGNIYYVQTEKQQPSSLRLIQLDQALKNYVACLKIKKILDDKKGIAQSYNNIGLVYYSMGNYPEALTNYFASLEIKKNIGHKAGIASSYGNIGNVYTKQKKYKEAEEYLRKAEKQSKEIGYKEYLKDAYSGLSILDSTKGNFKGAYENYKLYILYRDSLDNEETRKKTIQSQMTYDFEKKEAVVEVEHKKELENQKLLAEEKSRKQKIIISFAICGLLLVIVFASFILRSLRITRKQKSIIEEQKNIVEQQKQEAELQKFLVEEHQKEIIDSITYAERIQRSLLPTEKYIERNLNRLNKS